MGWSENEKGENNNHNVSYKSIFKERKKGREEGRKEERKKQLSFKQTVGRAVDTALEQFWTKWTWVGKGTHKSSIFFLI